tara:strand:+ start:893 stop:1837 length:945 start_codon:yes stop_codon:yes gene_type:complete
MGEIYADMIRQSGEDVEINYGGKIENHNDYNRVYVYHGNDWSGTLNLFGGVKSCPIAFNMRNFSNYEGEVISLGIDFPNYSHMLERRMEGVDDVQKEFLDVNLGNLYQMNGKSKTLKHPHVTTRLVVGDSHAICMYRPGWMIESIPFKTLYGALEIGLSNLVLIDGISEIEFYFGNIDIRHHLCRQDQPLVACFELADRYVEQLTEFSNKEISVYEPLPIENESRKLPKSGYYKGQPFSGSWKDRNDIRDMFIGRLKDKLPSWIRLNEWTKEFKFKNTKGELDFRYMENNGSVHLARHSYPYWKGQQSTLESFF